VKRVYKTKGADAKNCRVTIPVTRRLQKALEDFAAERKLTKTEAARMLVEKGLGLG